MKCRLPGGVARADDVDVVAGQRRRLPTRCAVEDSRPGKRSQLGHRERPVGDAGGEHDGLREDLGPVADHDGVRTVVCDPQLDGFAHPQEARAERPRLLVCAHCQIRAADAAGEAEVVADQRARSSLAADRLALDHQCREAFGCRVDRGGQAAGPGADHDDVELGSLADGCVDATGARDLGRRWVDQDAAVEHLHDRETGLVEAALGQQQLALLGFDRVEDVRQAVSLEQRADVMRARRPRLADDGDLLRADPAHPLLEEVRDRAMERLVRRAPGLDHVVVDQPGGHRPDDRLLGGGVTPCAPVDEQGAFRAGMALACACEKALAGHVRLAQPLVGEHQSERLARVRERLDARQRLVRRDLAEDVVIARVTPPQLVEHAIQRQRIVVDGEDDGLAGHLAATLLPRMAFQYQMNPHRTGDSPPRGGLGAPEFHRSMDGYAASELRDAPELAEAMRVRRVLLKSETERFGLPAFKILGASWAAERLLAERDVGGVPLVPAPDGNHGRAVARVARIRGIAAHVLVPAGTAQARIDGIASEGAHVEVVDGSYDEAVERAASMADDTHVVLSDTSWPGYEDVPRWVVEGYETIFLEADEQLRGELPDVAFIPIGVGSLAVAAAQHWPGQTPRLVGLEPEHAACALESIRAGEPVTVPGPHDSIMAGLNAGTVSRLAWPVLRDRFDAFCAIDDSWAVDGMRRLAAIGIKAGEVSGGTVGATSAVCNDADAREMLAIDAQSTLFLLLTEGLTDPRNWSQIVGSEE